MERSVIPMSWEEFEVMEQPFGWKVEYGDGQANLTPRAIGVTTRLRLAPRNFSHTHQLIPAHPGYCEQMIAGYFETFADSVEFCSWPTADIEASAEKDIQRFFSGTKGEPLSASVIALAPDAQQLIGVALFLLKPPEQTPYMDLLYVRPEFQHQGIATAMLGWGIDRLLAAGFQTLDSAYHICNEPSQRWHHRYGFEDVTDWYYARLKVGWYRSEIARRKKLGLTEGLDVLRQECDHWATQVDPEDLVG
ncbi:GNAT family N-acetyltransferase [filamentous cyanobacterium LEGE 11480]|uniref:GNAT family N-acetyltransferase n=1 Tax=Romeriopsis navalis LEGE 11480 TaxID=2777977 RepID=A0A928VGL5_9CYAN|nr:GNAT family N-acetyltransferase [Romeriopsis navalis]MBE9028236.1 GNAT family N-acetyltransferase [Romeriopsis navalis LEGE 11480]